MTFDEALIQASHNPDGSRFTMFGGPVQIGSLIIVNDADARMAESVITKTVPEFMNDRFLGFTQHATKVRAMGQCGAIICIGNLLEMSPSHFYPLPQIYVLL
jgi:hypothetical protein